MANIAPFEVIAGPANVWIAPPGTAFPLVNATPAVAWHPLGWTDGGISVTHNQNIEGLEVDQVQGPVKSLRTSEAVTVEFAIAQITPENYALLMNDATLTDTPAGTPPTMEFNIEKGPLVQTHALIIRGPSPLGDMEMQYQLPLVYQAEEPSLTFVRDDKATMNCSFVTLADMSQDEGDRYGKVIFQQPPA